MLRFGTVWWTPDSRERLIGNGQASRKALQPPFFQDSFQDLQDCGATSAACPQEKDSWMRTGRVASNVGKIKIQCDEETPVIADSFPDGGIRPSG
jgi:hypothetical protein